ncbi:hypothetical protein V8C35DRAFT_307005, partial [Trichoderma chlorosporum]
MQAFVLIYFPLQALSSNCRRAAGKLSDKLHRPPQRFSLFSQATTGNYYQVNHVFGLFSFMFPFSGILHSFL